MRIVIPKTDEDFERKFKKVYGKKPTVIELSQFKISYSPKIVTMIRKKKKKK